MMYTNSRYYEGILQLRPYNKKVLDYVKNEIEKTGNVFISREIVKKYGIDLYLTNKFFLSQLTRKLRKRFHGEVKRSSSLHKTSRMTSKPITRLTICFRLAKGL